MTDHWIKIRTAEHIDELHRTLWSLEGNPWKCERDRKDIRRIKAEIARLERENN